MGNGEALSHGGGTLLGSTRVSRGPGRCVKRPARVPRDAVQSCERVGECLGFAASAAAAAAANGRCPKVVVSDWTGGSQCAWASRCAVQEPKCDD